MKFIKTISKLMTVSAFVAVGLVALTTSDTTHATDKPTETPAKVAAYKYVAQPGDSYSQMARKAIQTYGINEKVKLTLAQIVYAETKLTEAAGSPYLAVGQVVELKHADVKSWADSAQKLSAADANAWQTYVAYIDFNTNAVGEKR